ncbi:MAG TPA: cell surface protein SprA, partial [Gemmatimonadaceae bacterium]|nr:cell surface protein SprA [Gemmatimonadaceae bacterium]
PALGRQFPIRYGAQSLDLTRASTLVWQSNGLDASGRAVRYTIEQIDTLTSFIGTGASGPEPVLWMTLYPLSVGGLRGEGGFKWTVGNTPGGKRWRSIRTPLGPSGSDLSRVENIEFWAQVYTSPTRRNRNPTLMLDFGDVSENSVTFGPDTAVVKLSPGAIGQDTTYTGKKLQGFDRLDSERDPFSRAFNVGVNDNGLAGDVSNPITLIDETAGGQPSQVRSVPNFPTCRGGFSFVHVLGDSRVDCTVANNRLDEEDIDGDNVLNLTSNEREQEELRRYIIDLSDASKFNRVGTCSIAPRVVVGPAPDSVCWVLFRIPFRAPDDSIGAPLLRRIKAMRITMLSSDVLGDAEFSRIGIARLRLTGSPWIKRLETGIRGIAGEQPGAGFVNASGIGTQDRKLSNGISYESPPGVIDEPDIKRSNFESNRIQVNERSLRITASDIQLYNRAEVYYRFPEGEKNFMAYKEMRLWARGIRNGWGENGDLQFFVKIGRDPNNFYLYRTPLNGGSTREAWLPEIKVDFAKLFKLRAEIQNAYLHGVTRNSCTGIDSALIANTTVPTTGRYVACADGYIVYTSDPGVSPPNLASVQELAVGMVRTGVGASSRPIAPGDTLELWVDDIRLGGVVDAAGFAGQMALSILASDFADIRVNVSRRDPNFRQLAEQPTFLTDNDINVSSAFHLEKLLPKSFGLTMPFTVNYTSASIDPLFVSQSDVEGDIVEGLRTPRSSATSITFSVARASPSKDARLAALWNNLSLISTYTAGNARSEYEVGHAHNFTVGLDYNLTNAILPGLARWTPAELHLTSVYSRGSDRRNAYLKPAFALDDIPRQINGLTSSWRNGTSFQLRPTKTLSGRLDFNSVRDLRNYGLDNPLGIITTAERDRVLGANTGMEREREMQAGINFTPTISSWIKPRLDIGSSYNMLRDANALSFERLADTTRGLRLPLRLGTSQTTTAGVTIDLPKAGSRYFDSTSVIRRLMTAIQPIDVNYNRSVISVFEGTPISAPLSYQLALGGIDNLRELAGQPATSAGIIRQITATHSIALPFGATLANRYQLINARNWTRRIDDTQAITDGTQVVFPDVALRWLTKPVALKALFSSIGGSARAVQTRQLNTRQPFAVGADGSAVDVSAPAFIPQVADRGETVVTSFPATLAIVFAGARPVSTNFGYALSKRREGRPGLSTKTASSDITAEIAKPWALPPSWKPRSDLRTRISYEETHGDNFVLNPFAISNESRLSDNGRRALSFSADTDIAENFSTSFVASRVESFDRNLNRRFTQTVLSAVLHLQFYAGETK